MIEFALTEEQLALRKVAADVARDRFAPHAIEWDRDSTFFPAEEARSSASSTCSGSRFRPSMAAAGGRCSTRSS